MWVLQQHQVIQWQSCEIRHVSLFLIPTNSMTECMTSSGSRNWHTWLIFSVSIFDLHVSRWNCGAPVSITMNNFLTLADFLVAAREELNGDTAFTEHLQGPHSQLGTYFPELNTVWSGSKIHFGWKLRSNMSVPSFHQDMLTALWKWHQMGRWRLLGPHPTWAGWLCSENADALSNYLQLWNCNFHTCWSESKAAQPWYKTKILQFGARHCFTDVLEKASTFFTLRWQQRTMMSEEGTLLVKLPFN